MMTLDGITMIALWATPSGRRSFWRVPASLVGGDALHRRFPRSSPRPKIATVLAIPSNVITL
jgi:hypothetical protein